MGYKMKTKINLLLTAALLLALPLFAQDDQHSSEIDSSVPELFEFHEVIAIEVMQVRAIHITRKRVEKIIREHAVLKSRILVRQVILSRGAHGCCFLRRKVF